MPNLIHDDTPNKLLSGVIYLYPEKNKQFFIIKKEVLMKKKLIGPKIELQIFIVVDVEREKNLKYSYQGDSITLVYNFDNKI